MSEHLKHKIDNSNLVQGTQIRHQSRSSAPQVTDSVSEQSAGGLEDLDTMTYEQAKQICITQMQELRDKIQELSPEEQQFLLLAGQQQCQQFLQNYLPQADRTSNDSQEQTDFQMTQDQLMYLFQQQLQAQAGQTNSEQGVQDSLNALQDRSNFDENPEAHLSQATINQRHLAALLQSQMGQNLKQEELMAHYQQQQKLLMRQQMGNQLRNFARELFKKINQRQKNKLFTKAKQYLDACIKDQRNLQKSKTAASTNPSLTGQTLVDSPMDFEFKADPQKYLDEIEQSLKRHKHLSQNFQRFIQKVFEDTEQEQVYTNFITTNPDVHRIYLDLAMKYNYCQHCDDEENKELLGAQIFNLIMPFAKNFDPRLLNMIPKETLDKFRIDYEDDQFHIRSWEELDESLSESSSDDRSDGGSDSNSDDSGSSNDQEISSNSQQIGDSSDNESNKSYSNSMSNLDMSQDVSRQNRRHGVQADGVTPVIPQHALTGKNKSLVTQLSYQYPNHKNLNKHEVKPLDNLFRSLKDDRDWIAFCKILYLYFEGVFSLTEFCKIYDEKFSSKLKQEIKDEIEKLLPTRDQNRRGLSNLLKPWNDTENQTFEKIPNSSYYKIEDGFPIPTCTRKMMEEIYFKNINDQYLSLATGSENFKFKFRNTNEEQIYKTEDKMYDLDTQIDNIQKSFRLVAQQCDLFETLSEADQLKYRFPTQILNPLRFYWDQKFRKGINDQYFRDGKVLKSKDMMALKKAFTDKLEFLRNQKTINLGDLKEQFRKNFTKSLDHKSFQYKDFMKKYLQKQNHINKIKVICQENNTKIRFTENQVSLLYGSGIQPQKSNYKFFNTFGKDFAGQFSEKRLQSMVSDSPIDMSMMHKIPDELRHKLQPKCPNSRFLMNNRRAFEITLKLVIANINQQALPAPEKQQLMAGLNFIIVDFLKFDNFDQVEKDTEAISLIQQEMIDILMNSAVYYQKKYEGELKHMQEVFPIDDPSAVIQSPLKKPKISEHLTEVKQKHETPSQVDTAPKQIKINDIDQQSYESCMFIPAFTKKETYQLFYAPLNIYMFLTFFYSIYERILKAEELVRQKMEQDFLDDFSQKEWSVKFNSRMDTLIDERFQYLIKSIVTVMSNSNILDTNKYEDIARELLGNEAYLLFQVDKLVNHCSKQLSSFQTDQSCISAKQMFTQFQQSEDKIEQLYMSNFYDLANQQLVQPVVPVTSKTNTGGANAANSAIAQSKDTQNPAMNLQAFRLLWSPVSQILSVHFVVLNPFIVQFRKDENLSAMETVEEVIPLTMRDVDYSLEKEQNNKVCESTPCIFLNRNLNTMKKLKTRKLIQENGLVTRVIPNLYQLAFESHTEDVIIAQRSSISKTLLGKRKFQEMADDYQMTTNARLKIQKRLNLLTDDIADAESSDGDEKRKTRAKAVRSRKTTPLKLEETL